MSGHRLATLTCDRCGEIWDYGINATIPEARKNAKKRGGWRSTRHGEDYCRNCKDQEDDQ